jgi:cytochrome c553
MNRQIVPVLLVAFVFALLVLVPASVQAQEFEYVGSAKCKKCHLKQFKSWESTTMAQAFESLRPGAKAEAKTAAGLDPDKDYTTDAACVTCHVTGMGKAGGFVDEASTPDLVGVGCESCHGAGGTYIQDEHMSLKNKEYKRADIIAVGMIDDPLTTCESCHNADSPTSTGEFVANKDDGIHEHHPLKYEH